MAPIIPSSAKHLRRRAYTLVEMTIALGIFAILVAGILAISLFTARSFEALGNYSDLDRDSRYTLDILSRDIRKSGGLASFNTNKIVLLNLNGTSVTYEWHVDTGYFTRTAGGVTRNLLRQCDSLSFDIFQRNSSGNFNFFSATGNLSQAKLVNVSWQCSRQIYAKKINTESVQTARIVIRN